MPQRDPSDPTRFFHAAVAAVAEACRVTRLVQAETGGVRSMTKDDRSPVTVADFASQAVIGLRLRDAVGVAPMVAEEDSAFLRDAAHAPHLAAAVDAARHVRPGLSESDFLGAIGLGARQSGQPPADGFWTLDPIDGTKGFLRGEQYAIALAWVVGGRPIVAALGCPNLAPGAAADINARDPRGVLYAAARGGGTLAAPADDPGALAPLAPVRRAPDSPIVLCRSREPSHGNGSVTDRVAALLGSVGPPLRLDSQCKYALVARGQADAYLRVPGHRPYAERIWDHAAGALIAEEAGAIVTDLDGKALDFSHGPGLERNRGVVCASRSVHARILGAILRVGPRGAPSEH